MGSIIKSGKIRPRHVIIILLILLLILLGRYIWKYKYIFLGMKNSEGWIFPVLGFVSSKFGPRKNPITGQAGQFHNGIDISAPKGTEIKAPADGTVTNVYFNNLGGNQIIITHLNGMKTGYAHLSATAVKTGDQVKQGQKIGEVGNTGASTGPHLHFTMRDEKGQLMDPEIFYNK